MPHINVIQSSSQKVLHLRTDQTRDYLDTIEVMKPSKINLERLSELLEKLYDCQQKSLPKLKKTLSTKEIKKFITLLVNWGQEYEVYELLNYAKKINHALDELDLENLSQLIADFPELRHTLLNKLY